MNAPFKPPEIQHRAFLLRLHDDIAARLQFAGWEETGTLMALLQVIEDDLQPHDPATDGWNFAREGFARMNREADARRGLAL